LFEGAPRFLRRLVDARPFENEDELFSAARAIAREMPEEEQIELLDAHPRIGADPATVSDLSRREQGDGDPVHDEQAWVGEELTALNEAYEGRFGFRFAVFVAGRPRVEIIPILERALRADRDEELRRGLDDVIYIAADRMESLRGPLARSSGRRSRSRSRAPWSARSIVTGSCARRIGSSRRESNHRLCWPCRWQTRTMSMTLGR